MPTRFATRAIQRLQAYFALALILFFAAAQSLEASEITAIPSEDFVAQESCSDEMLVKPNHKRATIALALGGGGIRGAAHIGVLRAFERAQIPIDFIAGSSMGAVVGGLYAAGVPLDKIEEVMLNRRKLRKAFIPCPMSLKVGLMLPKYLITRFEHRIIGTYKGNKVAKFVDSLVPIEQRQIENSKIKFAAVTSNLLDGNTYAIVQGSLGKAIQASTALPFMYRPVSTSDGKLLVDGGATANLPAYTAKSSKADIVIGVNVNEPLKVVKRKNVQGVFGLLDRTTNMLLNQANKSQLKYVDIEITPEMAQVNLYSHKLSDAKAAIEAGDHSATKMLPELEARIKIFADKIAGSEIPDSK